MPFTFQKLKIDDVIYVETKSFSDTRGFFLESFRESFFNKEGITTKFVQDNFSHSKMGVLRGLHYQNNPEAQAKLVIALRGEIFDVAVDIRKNSSTYGNWVGQILSDKKHNMLYIPEGFAHGFSVLSEEANVLYKVSREYSPEQERGIIWNDPDLNIDWKIKNPILSEKDSQLPTLKNTDNKFVNYQTKIK